MVDWQVGQRVVVMRSLILKDDDPRWPNSHPIQFTGQVLKLHAYGRDWVWTEVDDRPEFEIFRGTWYCAPRWLSAEGGPW